MNRQPQQDTLPWYRQFWPWFIMALPATAVIGGLVTVWIAVRTSDTLVYTTSEGINVVTERHHAAERRATAGGVSAVVTLDSQSGTAVVHLTAPSTPPDLSLDFSHPTQAEHDFSIELSPAPAAADGRQVWVGHFVGSPRGRYYAILSAGDVWRVSGEWFVGRTFALGDVARDAG